MKFKELKGLLSTRELYLYTQDGTVRAIDNDTNEDERIFVVHTTNECVWEKYGDFEVQWISDGHDTLIIYLL